MWRFYIYGHRKADSGDLFYIGKGVNRNGKPYFERAKARYSRSPWWNRIVSKHSRTVEIICMCQSAESSAECEQLLISHYGRMEHGGILINLTDGGEGVHGRSASEKTRRLMSLANRGKKRGPHSAEHREKIGLAHMGKKKPPLSLERKAMISAFHKGRKRPPFSESHRQKLSATAKQRAAITDETRQKLRAAILGKKRKPHSEDAKAKMAARRRQYYENNSPSEETRAKWRAAKLGKKIPMSEAGRANIAAARRRYCENRRLRK